MTSSAISTLDFPESHSSREDSAEPPREWSLWDELAAGRCVAAGPVYSSTHSALRFLRRSAIPTNHELRGNEFLRRVLVGEEMKEVAYACKRSLSTIASATTHSLEQMGFGPGLLYVPILLVRAAHLKSGFELPPLELVLGDSLGSYLVRIERPELCLEDFLSTSECEVLGSMLEGCSNAEIAARRGVAVRTVANQVASLSAKLGVSGRLELLRLFARGEQLQRATRLRRPRSWSERTPRVVAPEPAAPGAKNGVLFES